MDITSYLLGKKSSSGGGGGSGGLDWTKIGYSETPQVIVDGYNYAKNIYDNWDPTINMNSRFSNDDNLVFMPTVDTSSATLGGSSFYQCTRLIKVGNLDFSNITTANGMFNGCISLQEIAELDFSKVTDLRSFVSNCTNLINLGGFKNLGQSYQTTQSANYSRYTLDLSSHTNLTHDSLMNVINNLYNIQALGCNIQKLVIGNTNIEKLSDEEIAIATNKGWAVS